MTRIVALALRIDLGGELGRALGLESPAIGVVLGEGRGRLRPVQRRARQPDAHKDQADDDGADEEGAGMLLDEAPRQEDCRDHCAFAWL